MPGLPLKRIISAATVIFWVFISYQLIIRHYATGPDYGGGLQSDLPSGLFGEKWMGVYFRNEKIGHVMRLIERIPDGYKMAEKMSLNLTIMGSRSSVVTDLEGRFDLSLRLRDFKLILSGDASLTVEGVVRGNDLDIAFGTGDMKSKRTIALSGHTALGPSIVPSVLKDGLGGGKKITMTVIDPATLGRTRLSIESAGKETILIKNEKRETTRLKALYGGADFSVWVAADGDILKEETPLGFVLIQEDKALASRASSGSEDLVRSVSVPFNLRIPASVSYLKIRLSGIDREAFELDGGRQRLIGDMIEIIKEKTDPDGGLTAVTAENRQVPAEYLGDGILVDSKHPGITALSREIVGSQRNPVMAARKIHDWVYKNIEKKPSITLPVASEVLKSGRGDCNEHTSLFTALARASGIPTRMAFGLVYSQNAFYYHAWPEFFSGGWIAIDPTLGQFPADAAHIRLLTGELDKQSGILAAIGKIGLTGVEFR